jgi:hypothetical protein
MEDQTAPILTQAKREYTSQLVCILTPQIFDGIKSIYNESHIVCNSEGKKPFLEYFRGFLEKVPEWSQIIIETETDRIIQMSKCDWLDDLITAVFISHTKILTSIGNNSDANIDLTIPKTINFVHKCYINIAREIWKNPYLFDENVTGAEYQQNMRTVEIMIKESIEDSIRKSLPVKEILRQHLSSYEPTNQVSEKPSKNDIKQMLLEELRNMNQMELLKKINDDKTPELPLEDEGEVIDNDAENDDDDDYESPDEEELQEKCKDLEINTINDVSTEQPFEETYDNPDILIHEEEQENDSDESNKLLETFLQNISENETEMNEINSKIQEPNEMTNPDDPKITEGDNGRITDITDMETKNNNNIPQDETQVIITKITDVEDVKPVEVKPVEVKPVEVKPVEVKPVEVKPVEVKPVEEVITVDKNDSDDETVDEFFNDITKIMESKGHKINKQPKTYTLFDDAILEEE